MARKTILVDDIDGTESDDVQTYTFVHEGKRFEIDLNEDNAKKMHEAFSFYADKAREAGSDRPSRRTTRRSPASSGAPAVTPEDRDWLRKNGFPNIKDIGRISNDAREALAKRK